MPGYTVSFEVRSPTEIELPQHLLSSGGKYGAEIRDGDIYVHGNAQGLLYLAEVLIRCATGGFAETLHVHLPLAYPMQDDSTERPGDEMVVFAADPAFT
jgi:hypothetical protein